MLALKIKHFKVVLLLFLLSVLGSCDLTNQEEKEKWFTTETFFTMYPSSDSPYIDCGCFESNTKPSLIETGYKKKVELINSGTDTSYFETFTWPEKKCAELGYDYTGGNEYKGPNEGKSPGAAGYFADRVPQSSSCIVGTWKRDICNGTFEATLVFRANGTGEFSDRDCTDQCERYVPFSYTDNGNSVTLNYKEGTICGQPYHPAGGTQSYTCYGSTLFLGQEYTRQ